MALRRSTKLQNKKRLQIALDSFNGGVNTLLSETRIKKNEAKEALNLMLIEDGVWTKRWGTANYGTVLTSIDGAAEYVTSSGSRELVVIDNGTPKKSTDDGANWSTITGATFTAGHRMRFYQYGANDSSGIFKYYLYMVNGEDQIARYNGSTIETYTEIGAPDWAATPIARTGLTAGDYDYYYQVTAQNEVGETVGSTEETIGVNKARENWDTSNYVTLDWDAVTGAVRYVIYIAETSGYETYLTEVDAGQTSYVDDGTASPNTLIEPPIENTTGGPVLLNIIASGNRLWGVGANNLVYYTGSVGSERGIFSISSGGGFVGLERGGRAIASTIVDFQGNPHVFCKYPGGGGQIWKLSESTLTVGGQDVTVMVPTKIIDSTGTMSVGSVVTVENDVFYWDKGVRVLGNEPGVLNVLRTNELSSRIRPYIQSLDPTGIGGVESVYFDAKVFFSVPRNGASNDRIIVYDRERMAWYLEWTRGVDQFLVYTDTTGTTRLLGVDGGQLIEFSENYENDSGTAFSTRYTSPRIQVGGNDFTQFAKIKRAYIRLRETTGTVNISIAGTGKTESITGLASRTITGDHSNTGVSFELLSYTQLSGSTGSPETFSSESLIKEIVLNKLVRDLQITISTTGSGDQFALIGVLFEGLPGATGSPSSWRS